METNNVEIPYFQIDPGVRELVYVFNKIGFITEFSCEGHHETEDPEIIFHESVTKEMVLELCKKLFIKDKYFGSFRLWLRSSEGMCRKDGIYTYDNEIEIWENWQFYLPIKFPITPEKRTKAINKVVERLKELYQIK